MSSKNKIVSSPILVCNSPIHDRVFQHAIFGDAFITTCPNCGTTIMSNKNK